MLRPDIVIYQNPDKCDNIGLLLALEQSDMENSNKPCRCRGKFVAPGKFFPPPYCHNVTNANANPNPNLSPSPSPNPNPNLNLTSNPNPNPKFNPIFNLNPNPYCCVWK